MAYDYTIYSIAAISMAAITIILLVAQIQTKRNPGLDLPNYYLHKFPEYGDEPPTPPRVTECDMVAIKIVDTTYLATQNVFWPMFPGLKIVDPTDPAAKQVYFLVTLSRGAPSEMVLTNDFEYYYSVRYEISKDTFASRIKHLLYTNACTSYHGQLPSGPQLRTAVHNFLGEV